jgi:hypothetical protein
MRLDLPDRLVIETQGRTMTIGVRVSSDELAGALRQLLAGCEGPTPVLTAPGTGSTAATIASPRNEPLTRDIQR